jgi:poly(beta-D-mannuronate) lyase
MPTGIQYTNSQHKGNPMIRCIIIFFLALLSIMQPDPAMAASSGALFDIQKRRAQLQTPEFSSIRDYCMATKKIKQPVENMPEPIPALKPTKEYGTDHSMEDFNYYLMIHSGRALAGDKGSEKLVADALLAWAKAGALLQTEENYDPYYALKRGLLPIITSYEIIRPSLSTQEADLIRDWIDTLVRRIDVIFNKEVDQNNHRYLADAVVTLWGDVIGDVKLYDKGKERFLAALSQMTDEGALPMEVRRGARALWYVRQSLANLTLIAQVYKRNGESLYTYQQGKASLPLLMNYFITGVRYPFTVLQSASQNHIPGPSANFLEQDMGMLKRRGHGRHYMAFAEMYLAPEAETESISRQRLDTLMRKTAFQELPLIDEFAGGNATCFWGVP